MATNKTKENDTSLPFTALQLLAPPVRLVSAALWKVMKQRDVMQYGVVEEFVTSACETVPGLLTVRHQGRLALGLRGRLILELCCTQPDVKVIEAHMKRICVPAVPSSSSAAAVKNDAKITNAVETFHSFVQTLLTDPKQREHFYKEDFPVEYGPKFDEELEKLLWDFLIRLDQLLPVPSLAQTVSWLSTAPSVLEECARAATQPQLLNVLLQHQTCLGHLEPAASLPPNMGDSILDSLSLPLSGKLPSNHASGPSSKDAQSKHTDPKENLSDLSVLKERPNPRNDDVEKVGEGRDTFKRNRGMKRRQPDSVQSDFNEEVEVIHMTKSRKNRIRCVRRGQADQRASDSEEDGVKPAGNKGCTVAILSNCMNQLGIKTLYLPDDPSLFSTYVSCLCNRPTVVIEKLPVAAAGANGTGRAQKSFCKEAQNPRRRSPVKAPTQRPDSYISGVDDKENHPVLPSGSSSPSLPRSNTEMLAVPASSEDYVADSEDEGTKNFKSRLFMKRYYKTKHGTYVPTLREFWRPGITWRDFLSSGRKCR